MTIRVLLSGKRPIVLNGLKSLLEQEPDLEVAAPCTNIEDTLAGVREFAPDVVIMEREIAGREPGPLLANITAAGPRPRVALLGQALGVDELLEALRLGVAGVAVTQMRPSLFVQCIRTLHAGHTWVEPRALACALDTLRSWEASSREASRLLTPREIEVARIVAEGLSNGQIAKRLAITEGTVKTHLHRLYQKLQLKGRQDLAQYVRDRGLGATAEFTADDVRRALRLPGAKPDRARSGRDAGPQ